MKMIRRILRFFTRKIVIRCVKLVEHAKLPQKNRFSDMGWDFFCVIDREWKDGVFVLNPGCSHTFSTGLQVSVPPNYGFILRDRSGYGIKDITVEAGVIEGTYRGEWKVHLINLSKHPHVFKPGDKIVQAILTKIIPAEVEEVSALDYTDRGDKGFGSSGF